MMMMMMCVLCVMCIMCMGPFSELFKGVGSLVGATGDLVGGAASGAAKGVKGLGDVVSGEAFKPKLKRAPQPMEDGIIKLVEHGRKEEEERRRREELRRKKEEWMRKREEERRRMRKEKEALAALNKRFN